MSYTVPVDATVLVIDDVEQTRSLLANLLRRQGYAVLEAAHASEGLAVLRAARPRPCVVVLDLMMSGGSGWSFREEQLRDPAISDIPVIVFTSARQSDALRYVLKTTDILHKPVAIDDLIDTIGQRCRAA
jgi:CheY-like chemotaxis protein